MAVWFLPIAAAAVSSLVGANKLLDKKLKAIKEEEEEADKRYQVLADGVVPDLYQFFFEMDGVISRLDSRKEEKEFTDNFKAFTDFLCHCNEPGGVPTVQNMMMMAMAAKNCDSGGTAEPIHRDFAKVLGGQIMGEIMRTSPNKRMATSAVTASAKIFDIMFPEVSSCISIFRGRRLKSM